MQEFVDHVAVLFKPGDRLDIQKWRPSVTLVVERETDKGIFFFQNASERNCIVTSVMTS